MLQELMSRTLDIYIALVTGFATGIPCTLLGIAIDRLSKKRAEGQAPQGGVPQNSLTIEQAIQVRVNIQVSVGGAARGDQLVWGMLIAATCIAYLFLRQQVLFVAMVSTFALVWIWIGVAAHSLYRGYFRGVGWWLYMIGMLAFVAVGVVPIILAAQTPQYAPTNFAAWQAFAKDYGIDGLRRSGELNWQSVTWLLSHVTGVALMFAAIRDAVLSMFFYASVSGRSDQNTVDRLPLWAARHAIKSVRGLVWLVVILVLAYYLVDGSAYVFYTQKFPVLVNELWTYVLYGARGLR
ncbi:hypothetical protein WS62_08450 [Burkholderia sp. ABCPW 14]|uniref:hypothetical protein n=1 Tax=Burkholderia sp. ABCPW 14 TaxID=1637860 RepID=UPI000770C72E|nr:hypothetical protein [Burkholderia sp. ABCPW 14]KVD73550.1 hypothetical protein WS62_08450 [Burkholderia sp. ABCPW 14]